MEIGHNVCHGQWDWMNDPENHSSTWEWDMVALSSQWRYSHNYRHHVFSNILGMDDGLGFGVMRVTRDQPWRATSFAPAASRTSCWQALRSNGALPLHDVDLERTRAATAAERADQAKGTDRKGCPPSSQGLRALAGAGPNSVAGSWPQTRQPT